MALADTVQDLLAQKKIKSALKPNNEDLIANWRRDIEIVLTRVRDSVQPFVDSGSAIVDSDPIEIDEDAIGNYLAPSLVLTIADRRIIVAPVARITFGGTGRIDMYRDDRPSERERFLIVRESGGADVSSLPWLLENKDEDPPEALLSFPDVRRSSRRFYRLSQAGIESAIDYLLRMR